MINGLFHDSAFFGIFITLWGFYLGVVLKKRFNYAIFNPLLIAVAFVLMVLVIFRVDYEVYMGSANHLNLLLTPATICFAVPLYRQWDTLKANLAPIVAGIASGVLATLGSVFIAALLLKLPRDIYLSLLAKSTTTAIGIGITEALGGIVPLTVIAIVITGNIGNLMAFFLCRLFRLEEPVARGIAIGTASHVIGTVKAFEMGEVEGAMSSLAIILAGMTTVFMAPLFATLL